MNSTTPLKTLSKPTSAQVPPWRVVRPESESGDLAPQVVAAKSMVVAKQLVKSYKRHKTSVAVLKGVDFSADQGKITAIVRSKWIGQKYFASFARNA